MKAEERARLVMEAKDAQYPTRGFSLETLIVAAIKASVIAAYEDAAQIGENLLEQANGISDAIRAKAAEIEF